MSQGLAEKANAITTEADAEKTQGSTATEPLLSLSDDEFEDIVSQAKAELAEERQAEEKPQSKRSGVRVNTRRQINKDAKEILQEFKKQIDAGNAPDKLTEDVRAFVKKAESGSY